MFRISQKLVVRKFVDASAKRSVSTKISDGFNLISEHAVPITAVVGLFGSAYGVITSIVSKDLKQIGEKMQSAQDQHDKDFELARNQSRSDFKVARDQHDKDFELARNQSRSDFKVARDQLNTDFSGIRDQMAKEFKDVRDQNSKEFKEIRDQNKRDFDENLKKFDTIEQSLVAIVNKLNQK
jgi:hypothetical protein